jgi:putative RecB family exonuclease
MVNTGLKVELSHLRPWSFSKVQKAKKCQYEFYFRYVEKLEPLEKADFFVVGSGVHFVLEGALNLAFREGKPLRKDTLFRFVEEFKLLEPAVNCDEIYPFFPNILKFVNGQIRRVGKASLVASEVELAVDESLQSSPFGSSSVFLRGKLDFLFEKEGTLYIVDHKTSRSTEFDKRVKTQLRWYALLASVEYSHFERFALELHNVRYGTIRRFIFSRKELAPFKEKLLSILSGVEKEYLGKSFSELVPSPSSSNCSWCEYRHICPAYGGKR